MAEGRREHPEPVALERLRGRLARAAGEHEQRATARALLGADALDEQRHPPGRGPAAVERHAHPRAAEQERAAALEGRRRAGGRARSSRVAAAASRATAKRTRPLWGARPETGAQSQPRALRQPPRQAQHLGAGTRRARRGRGGAEPCPAARADPLAAQPAGDPLAARCAARRPACAGRTAAGPSARGACRTLRTTPLTRTPGRYSTVAQPQHRVALVQVERPAPAAQAAAVEVEAAAAASTEERNSIVTSNSVSSAALIACPRAPGTPRRGAQLAQRQRRRRQREEQRRALPRQRAGHGLAAEEAARPRRGRTR